MRRNTPISNSEFLRYFVYALQTACFPVRCFSDAGRRPHRLRRGFFHCFLCCQLGSRFCRERCRRFRKPTEAALPDGVYTAEFDTDSGMFHANEACNGMGTLTVENGRMTFHVSLASKKIVNLYVGMAADAEANKADWLLPTTDTVTYSDGTSEEVYGYDIPVAAVDQDFQLALLGTKGKWYDHTVSIRNAQPKAEEAAETPADGEYSVNVTLEGGSGRATVESPAALTVADGKMTAVIRWSSPNYDYMIVDGEKYLPTNTEGNSTFEIPVSALGTPLAVTADTVAMSTPHEIEYTLTFALN